MATTLSPARPDVLKRPDAIPSRALLPGLEPDPAPPLDMASGVSAAPLDPPRAHGRRGLGLAVLAVVIALTAPFWEASVLGALGIRTPAARAVEQSTLLALRLQQRNEDLSQRLTAAMAQITRQQLEFTAAMQRADQAAALIRTMSLVRLGDTLRRPMPFAAELTVARASGTDLGDLKPLLDQIAPYAGTGIPGTAQLRQEFRTLLDEVSRAAGGGSPSWMSSLVAWTRLRSVTPPPTDADVSLDLLRSASARLDDIDLVGAVEQTQQVNDPYKPLFANWLEDARARIAADTLAERASDMVTRTLRAPATQ